jgi:hypothetical protein
MFTGRSLYSGQKNQVFHKCVYFWYLYLAYFLFYFALIMISLNPDGDRSCLIPLLASILNVNNLLYYSCSWILFKLIF